MENIKAFFLHLFLLRPFKFSSYFQFEGYGAVALKPKLKSQRFATAADTRPTPPLELRTQRLSGSRLQRLNHRPPHPRPVPHPCPWQIAVGCGQQGPADCCRHNAARLHFYTGHTKEEVWRVAVRNRDNRRFLFHSNTVHLPPGGVGREPRRARGSRWVARHVGV